MRADLLARRLGVGRCYGRPDLLLAVHILALIGLSLLFSQTLGFAYSSGGAPSYTSELQSSGSDDNFSLNAGAVIFGIALLFAALPSPRLLAWQLKSLAIALCWLIQLALIPPEVGEIGYTIFRTGNAPLALWLVAFSLLPMTLLFGASWKSRAQRSMA